MESQEPASQQPVDGVEVACACRRHFRAPTSLRGGITNCPYCGKAVEVPRGAEPLFWILLSLAVLVVLVPAATLLASGNVLSGLVVLLLGGLLIAGVLILI